MAWDTPERIYLGPFETQTYAYWINEGDYAGTQSATPTDFIVDSVHPGGAGPVTAVQGIEGWYDKASKSKRYKYWVILENTTANAMVTTHPSWLPGHWRHERPA